MRAPVSVSDCVRGHTRRSSAVMHMCGRMSQLHHGCENLGPAKLCPARQEGTWMQ